MWFLHINEIFDYIRKQLDNKSTSIRKIIVFGSVARGDYTPESDLDLLIIADDIQEAKCFFGKIADDLYLKYLVPVTAIYVSSKILKENKLNSFLKTVLSEGKVIWRRK